MNWISIKDAVPPDDRKVLILYHMSTTDYDPYIAVGLRQVYKNGKVKWKAFTWYGTSIIAIESIRGFYTVTHWMPLPSLPEKYNNEDYS